MANKRISWSELRARRMTEPGTAEEYDATRLAYQLGTAVRELREQRGWSQTQLASAAGMTQSAVARFEAGGTVPTLPVLERLAHASTSTSPSSSSPAPTPRSRAIHGPVTQATAGIVRSRRTAPTSTA